MSTSADAMRTAADAAARPAKRVKLLTGAPDPAKLSWDESALLNDWTPAVRRFLNRQFAGGEEEEEPGNAAASKWRIISTSRHAHLRTGFTQESPLRKDFLYAPAFADAEHSFAFSSQPSDEGTPPPHNDAALTTKGHAVWSSSPPQGKQDDVTQDDDFIEHSIAVHDDMHSSQLALDPTELDVETTMLNLDHSFNTNISSLDGDSFDYSRSELQSELLPDARLPRHITALKDIPSASHLQRIVPQTVVVNLLVGVIAILPPRAVRTRGGLLRDLVELLVGDETATGLKVSFWFAHEADEESQEQGGKEKRKKQPPKDPLREALKSLRVQDVVLVENVALDTFRDRVFGYSLRKSIQKNQTRIELLARNGLDRAAGLTGVEKVVNVKDWVWRLVNPGAGAPQERGGDSRAGAGGRARDAYLPPDTQE